MSLFDQLGQQQANPMQMVQQLRADPVGYLKRAGLNVPDGMTDPQQIIQHLMRSGQVPANRYQAAMQMIQRMGRR